MAERGAVIRHAQSDDEAVQVAVGPAGNVDNRLPTIGTTRHRHDVVAFKERSRRDQVRTFRSPLGGYPARPARAGAAV